ncbi:MAG: hypothetical protein H6512_08105 [Acidimicrobiia bacterium]|nr:hypothetical protein [Acidimicrobiia bacterium]
MARRPDGVTTTRPGYRYRYLPRPPRQPDRWPLADGAMGDGRWAMSDER